MADISLRYTTNKDTDTPTNQTLKLDITARFQWQNDNGYCGEMSLQSIGLYYGAWISQKLIFDINQGEYLLQPISNEDHRDPLRTLTSLHFTYDEWDWTNAPQPQFRDFCRWMKRSILQKHPVIFGIFLPDSDCLDYDHIVPAVGIRYKNENEYDPDDELIYYDLYSKEEIKKRMNEDEFGATRDAIDMRDDADDDGYIPLNIDYGIAITGIIDEDKVTLPVHLSVSSRKEPNPAFSHKPAQMNGIVTIDKLTIGNSYALLRYSSYQFVPTKGNANAFLESNYDERHIFTAIETTYIYNDPKKISSTGSVYYRCVPMSD